MAYAEIPIRNLVLNWGTGSQGSVRTTWVPWLVILGPAYPSQTHLVKSCRMTDRTGPCPGPEGLYVNVHAIGRL